jgi:hypothetical protein
MNNNRNGMLQTGDRILFIDNTSLRNKTINEINHLLKTADEVVKLKIKKDESYTDDNTDEKVVVYTVEMQRNGGPLGITISGSDDLFEPMFVSGLTEGGLAERYILFCESFYFIKISRIFFNILEQTRFMWAI